MPARWVVGVGLGGCLLAAMASPAHGEEPSVESAARMAGDTAASALVSVDQVRVEGPLDVAAVEGRLEKGLAPVRRCYAKAVKADPAVAGHLELRLLVMEKGRVSAATLERSTVGQPDLEKCIRRHAMDLRFSRPGPPGHATIRYTVSFSARAAVSRLASIITSMGTAEGGAVSDVLHGGSIAGIDEALEKATGVTVARPVGSGRVVKAKGTAPRSRVAIGTIGATGALDTKVIRRGIERRLGAIRACHGRELTTTPGLSGDLELRLAIDSAGRVTKATSGRSTLSSSRVEDCVARQGRLLRFEKASGETRARVSLSFEPAKSPAP